MPKSSFILIALSGLFSSIGMLGTIAPKPVENESKKIHVVATREIEPGERLDASAVTAIEFAGGPEDTGGDFEECSKVIGRYANVTITPDEPIKQQMLIETPAGTMVHTVTARGPGAKPTDRVDIHGRLTFDGSAENLAGDLLVFACEKSDFDEGVYRVQVAVQRWEADRLSEAARHGDLHFSVRPSGRDLPKPGSGDQLAALLLSARKYAHQGEVEKSLEAYDAVISKNPNILSREDKTQLKELRRERKLLEAEQAETNGDLAGALTIITQLRYRSTDLDTQARLDGWAKRLEEALQKKRFDLLVQQAQRHIDGRQFREAEAALTKLRTEFPASSQAAARELAARLDEVVAGEHARSMQRLLAACRGAAGTGNLPEALRTWAELAQLLEKAEQNHLGGTGNQASLAGLRSEAVRAYETIAGSAEAVRRRVLMALNYYDASCGNRGIEMVRDIQRDLPELWITGEMKHKGIDLLDPEITKEAIKEARGIAKAAGGDLFEKEVAPGRRLSDLFEAVRKCGIQQELVPPELGHRAQSSMGLDREAHASASSELRGGQNDEY